MTEKRWLWLILVLFVIVGSTYALVTPPFEASDELWHYPMLRHLADGNPLPVQVFDPAQAGPWKQEASQPPLYYYLGAALTFWIDTGDMDQVRLENPHVDNGLITADGNINLVIHDPAASRWQGTLLAVTLVRLFSVLLGAVTVYLTYAIGKQVAPQRPEIGLGAAALNAFTPMFLFISGAVNNDNLAVPLASLALLLLIRTVTAAPPAASPRQWVGAWLLIGVVIGLAILTKQGALGLLPLAWGAAFIASWQVLRRRGPAGSGRLLVWQLLRALAWSLVRFAVLLLPVLLIAGWWYYRNLTLYGDWLGWNAFIAVLGQRARPASLLQLWGERRGFLMSYWGLFGGVNVPMANWVYTLLNGLLLLGAAGFGLYLFKETRAWRRAKAVRGRTFQALVLNVLGFVTAHFALVVCFLFATAVVIGLARWATTTWSSQGRLVFTAISALNVLLAAGLVGWMPHRPAQWTVGGLGALLVLLAALAPFVWIRPAYDPDAYAPPRPYTLQPRAVVYGEALRLRGMGLRTAVADSLVVRPGDALWVHLEWEVLAPMDRTWSVFVHLNDPVLGQPIAQRDMYLGQGLLSTRWLAPGERLVNSYRLQVPPTAVAPAALDLVVGLYDFQTGERLPIGAGQGAALLARLQLEPLPGDTPNPVAVNFENALELVGFEVAPRRAQPGATITLTLYWRAQRPLTADYHFFAQVVGADTTRWAAQDLPPESLPLPTSQWPPGAVQAVQMTLPLRDDTPPQLYPLIIGVYTRTPEGGFDRLQLVTADGRLTDDFLALTPVRVD
jgi:4-amino-4-deoxy-L-arabinose transferase-like glycosyltransferase